MNECSCLIRHCKDCVYCINELELDDVLSGTANFDYANFLTGEELDIDINDPNVDVHMI